MPVPKRKTSKSRRDMRQSTKFIRAHIAKECSNCQFPLNPHEMCQNCGYYKGRKIAAAKLDKKIKHGHKVAAQHAAEQNDQDNKLEAIAETTEPVQQEASKQETEQKTEK